MDFEAFIALEVIEPIQSLVAEVAEDGLLGVHLGLHHAYVVKITLKIPGGHIWSPEMLFLCILKQYKFYLLRYKRMFTCESKMKV